MELYVEDGKYIWQNARVKTVRELLDEGWKMCRTIYAHDPSLTVITIRNEELDMQVSVTMSASTPIDKIKKELYKTKVIII